MKKLSFLFAAIFFVANVFALEVSKSELQNVSDTAVEFINYTGPHKVIDSVDAIRGIGSDLANVVKNNPSDFSKNGNISRYYVIHAVDSSKNPSEKGKLDADIIIIGKNATVDHIENVRRIISAYLSTAYGYSQEDSDTLAVFITVYNAVYRGNLDSFNSKYKSIVVSNLTKENCGLSVNYKDWPGQSEIVIPLFDVAEGGLSTVDTSVISDTKVVTSMKEDDDKNVEARKNLVDIKEREADDAYQKAQTAQKTAVAEQKKAEEEKAKTLEVKKEAEEAKKEAEQSKEEAQKKQKEAEENPDDEQAQAEAKDATKKAEEAQSQAQQKQDELENQEQKQAEAEQKAKDSKEEAKQQQAVADKKQNEAQAERKEIAKDQKEVLKKQAEQAKMPSEYAIILTDEDSMLSKLVRFNKETGEIIKSSPVSVIRNRTIFSSGNNYFAIAGEDSANGTVKLVSIDKDSMEISGETEYKISANSVLVQDDDGFYCVTDENGKYFVAKFADDLSLKQKSSVEVKGSTPITVTESGIVVTGADGSLKVLDSLDLSDISM